MSIDKETRKKANIYFFTKVLFNTFLIILGAVLIALFLRRMQYETAQFKQRESSEAALVEVIETLKENEQSVKELSYIYHDANQDMLDDLHRLLTSGLFDSLGTADNELRSRIFADIVERSGVDYLFIMSDNGTVLLSPYPEYYNVDLVHEKLLTRKNQNLLLRGTRSATGVITPALEDNDYGYYYFYSMKSNYNDTNYHLVLGANAEMLDVQIASLKDLSAVLSRAAIENNGFMFAVNTEDNSFLYYQNGNEVLTGQNALDTGLSQKALQDGYAGVETINGTRYYCVSRTYGDRTVICAVADTGEIYINDRYVLFWSIAGFILVMLMCLAYAIVVRNDFVRNAVVTDKKIFSRKNKTPIIFDRSIFKKVFPLMIAGVLVIYGISFYTQTLLEISECIDESVVALNDVTARYEEGTVNRKVIQDYYDNLFLAKARLISYLIEEDPSVLNEPTTRYYSSYNKEGDRVFLVDDEGNRLRSVASSALLQELCDANDLYSIYIFDEDGRTIATNTPNWYFTISHNAEDQSYPFLRILEGKNDTYVQDAMMSDVGELSQYIGSVLTYYTTVDEQGNTVYVSRFEYEQSQAEGTESETVITPHRSLVQIGLNNELTAKFLASTEISKILSSDLLSGGFIVLFDNTPEHICMYSPTETSIGKSAGELGVSSKAFGDSDYYGFTHVNGKTYFQYFHYKDGYYVGTAIPRKSMYQSRFTIAVITSLTSLLLIMILSLTVTLTTEEEELLYETMSETELENALDSAIFNIVLPSGRKSSTVKASARWNNQRIPWSEKNPEQKLLMLISFVFGILILYVLISIIGADRFFPENSIIHYILSGNWDRGVNIFAFSACALIMIFTAIGFSLFRIPVRITSTLLGARGETIGHLLLSVLKYGGALGAFFYCLYLVGMDASNLLASAGVLSLVIGLGAQSLIKDIIAGIFIVFEGEFRVGDIVTISGYRGTVVDIGLRTTKIQSPDGNIKIFNNSDISGVLNMTKEASIASASISIEYGQDIEYVEAVLKKELPLLKEKNTNILDGPTYLGITSLGDSGVTILVIAKAFEKDVRGVNRYLNRELLQIFYRNGINVPFPNVTVSQLNAEGRKTIADFKDTSEENGEEEQAK